MAEAENIGANAAQSLRTTQNRFEKWMVTPMKTRRKKYSTSLDAPLIYPALIVFVVWFFAASSTASVSGTSAQATFASPVEAGQALAAAIRANNEDELRRILGPDAHDVVGSGDIADDTAARQSFVTKYDKMNRWVAMTDGTEVLYIGADNFPFPIPLVSTSDSRWYFDMAVGKQEMLARRIGRNELLAIDACYAIADAEEQYFLTPHNGSTVREYAQLVISGDGKQDGLYWPASATQPPSPLAILTELPKVSVASLAPGQALVLDGYTLRILTAQGAAAPGGAKSYIVNGKMTGGYAILATPVKYGKTGIMTFLLGSEGPVYESDLGSDTDKAAASLREFNPAAGWSSVE